MSPCILNCEDHTPQSFIVTGKATFLLTPGRKSPKSVGKTLITRGDSSLPGRCHQSLPSHGTHTRSRHRLSATAATTSPTGQTRCGGGLHQPSFSYTVCPQLVGTLRTHNKHLTAELSPSSLTTSTLLHSTHLP